MKMLFSYLLRIRCGLVFKAGNKCNPFYCNFSPIFIFPGHINSVGKL